MSLVTEIKVTPLKSKDAELVAFAEFTINNAVRCKSVAILRRLGGGYRLAYPTKKLRKYQTNYFFPINASAGREIECAVVSEYRRVAEGE